MKLGKLPHYRLHWPAQRQQVRETSVVKKSDLERFLNSRTTPRNVVPAGSTMVRKRQPLIPPAGCLSLQEASRIAGVDTLTIRGWVRSGRVRSVRVPCPGKPEYVLRVYPHRASLLRHLAWKKASPPGLITLLEASRLTEVSLHTVKSWIKSKRLRYRLGVINGRPIRFVGPSDVRLLQTRRIHK